VKRDSVGQRGIGDSNSPDPDSPPRRITHRDVALRAGVSPAVVSYVINDGPRTTSPRTRERVLQAIAELDYHPNAMARGLRAQRTQTVGFIDSDYAPLDVSSRRTALAC